MRKLRIFLADDHVVVREGLRRLIDSEKDMEVVGEANDGREALSRAPELNPDIAVMDISMPDLNGAQTTQRLKRMTPAIKVLALTVHEDTSYLRELLDAGASGYVVKRAAGDELIRAIRAVAAGGVYIDPRVAGKVISTYARIKPGATSSIELSERETEVLKLIAKGHTNKEIAGQLGVSVKTIETYKARSMDKLGLRSRVDIVRVVGERGWLATS